MKHDSLSVTCICNNQTRNMGIATERNFSGSYMAWALGKPETSFCGGKSKKSFFCLCECDPNDQTYPRENVCLFTVELVKPDKESGSICPDVMSFSKAWILTTHPDWCELFPTSGHVFLPSPLSGSSTEELAELQSEYHLNTLKTATVPFRKISACRFGAGTETLFHFSDWITFFPAVSGETCSACLPVSDFNLAGQRMDVCVIFLSQGESAATAVM